MKLLATATARPVFQLVGGNVAGHNYWDRPRLTVNMLRQGYRFSALSDGSRPASLDQFGDPTEDFSFTLHWLITNGQQLKCAGRAGGYCALSDIYTDSSKVTVSDWGYNQGKNEVSF